jgi:endogenous inhibitor of DNA gyrase (YacG/DUF329 family)
MAVKVKCPTCKKQVELGAPEFPFCSERCRQIDLGCWAEEKFRIPVVDETPDADEIAAAENEAEQD